jgi:adenosylmethionine---8-amino-7-oxononanoate aminotransferase
VISAAQSRLPSRWPAANRVRYVEDLIALDAAHVWHPYAPYKPTSPPYVVTGADGVRLALADGREVIDGMAAWWSAIHGYNHPVLNAAATEQLGRMSHVMFGGLTHEPAVALAKLLVEVTPEQLTRVFFSDSGSVAVEVAVKMAIQYWSQTGRPRKRRLLTIRGGYHGDTFAAMSVCDPVTGMHQVFSGAAADGSRLDGQSLLARQLFAPRPGCRFGEPYGPSDNEELARLLDQHHDEVAAIILEPVVQGAGGMWFYAPEYVSQVRRLADDHDVLLILDEIATGFGRTGRLFAAEHAGIAPDILCLGKAMTGGYVSMAATMCTERVAAGVCAGEAGVFMHGPTFMANPLAARISRASIELLLDSPWEARVADLERRLASGLAPARRFPGVADVRVLGAIGVIEARDPIDVPRVQGLLLEHGVWLRPFGKLLYTMPPYIIDEADTTTLTSAMVAAADALA